MSRRSTRAPFLAALVLLASPLALTACSSADDDVTPPSPGTDSSWSAAMGSCLRDAGYDVDDSELTEGVVAPPSGVDFDAYAADYDTCRSGLPDSVGGGDDQPSADDLAAAQATGVKIAQCVRDAGFPDFADPVDGAFPPMSVEQTPETKAFFDCDEKYSPEAGRGAK